MPIQLTRAQIVGALQALDRECARREITGELCIYGGAEMVLVFDARASTRDVDAIFRPKTEIMAAARSVAEDLGLPSDWMNDGVKGFLSPHEALMKASVAELQDLQNVRIVFPTADYLLAMKCVAARTEAGSSDRADVLFLLKALAIHTEQEVFERIARFYPMDRLHVKIRYFVSEIVAELAQSPVEGREKS